MRFADWIRRGGLLTALALLCATSPAQEGKAPLRVLATTQSLGNLEPCNCVEGMLGGFPRRLATLRRLQATQRGLVVDCGDLTGKEFHPGLLRAKTRATLDLLRKAGTQAVAVGDLDLRLGVEPLQRLADEAGVTLLGANLLKDGAPAFQAAVTVTVDGRKVRVAGALDPELGDPSGELTLAPAGPALLAALDASPADVRVVLFHGSAQAARAQLAKVRADVIVCGHDATTQAPLGKLGGAHLVVAQRDARSVACLRLGPNPVLRHVPLGRFVPDDPWARRRVDRYYEEVRGLPEPPRKETEGGSFVGAEGCKACHPMQYEVFAGTKHHGVQARVQAADPKRANLAECTQCHVTGRGFESGFVDMNETPHLAEVGCESCHGVGGNHVKRGGGRGYGLLPNFPKSWKPVCVSCHDKSNSPKFEFESWLERIKHWPDR